MYPRRHEVRFGPELTRMVKLLILANVGAYLWTVLAMGLSGSREIYAIFGLVPVEVWAHLHIWQLVTYIFLHGDFFHILMNMFILWMFGAELERHWGSREFLRFFFITGIGAGLFSVLLDPFSGIPTIGASGAIYGLLMAYGLLFPNRIVHIYFLFPVKVKYFVAFLGVMAFVSSLSSPGSTIAHAAHLGGMVVAFIHLRGWLSLGAIRQAYYRWKIRRMRGRFRVYENQNRQPRRRDDDFWIN